MESSENCTPGKWKSHWKNVSLYYCPSEYQALSQYQKLGFGLFDFGVFDWVVVFLLLLFSTGFF